MNKHQDLKNEVKRSRKLKNAKVGPVKVGASRMMTKNLTEITGRTLSRTHTSAT